MATFITLSLILMAPLYLTIKRLLALWYVTLKAPQFWLHHEKLVILMCSLLNLLLYAKVYNNQLIKVFVKLKLSETLNFL